MAYETHSTDDRPEVVKATRARQGSWGRHIFWVLIISTALAAIALFASFAFNASNLQGEGGQTVAPSAAPLFNEDAPTPKVTDAERTGPYPR